jgi:hypothetical protein
MQVYPHVQILSAGPTCVADTFPRMVSWRHKQLSTAGSCQLAATAWLRRRSRLCFPVAGNSCRMQDAGAVQHSLHLLRTVFANHLSVPLTTTNVCWSFDFGFKAFAFAITRNITFKSSRIADYLLSPINRSCFQLCAGFTA